METKSPSRLSCLDPSGPESQARVINEGDRKSKVVTRSDENNCLAWHHTCTILCAYTNLGFHSSEFGIQYFPRHFKAAAQNPRSELGTAHAPSLHIISPYYMHSAQTNSSMLHLHRSWLERLRPPHVNPSPALRRRFACCISRHLEQSQFAP